MLSLSSIVSTLSEVSPSFLPSIYFVLSFLSTDSLSSYVPLLVLSPRRSWMFRWKPSSLSYFFFLFLIFFFYSLARSFVHSLTLSLFLSFSCATLARSSLSLSLSFSEAHSLLLYHRFGVHFLTNCVHERRALGWLFLQQQVVDEKRKDDDDRWRQQRARGVS